MCFSLKKLFLNQTPDCMTNTLQCWGYCLKENKQNSNFHAVFSGQNYSQLLKYYFSVGDNIKKAFKFETLKYIEQIYIYIEQNETLD